MSLPTSVPGAQGSRDIFEREPYTDNDPIGDSRGQLVIGNNINVIVALPSAKGREVRHVQGARVLTLP